MRDRIALVRSMALLAAVLQLMSCVHAGPPPKQLAADQTLRIPIKSEPSPGSTSLDPAYLLYPVETAIADNLFDGLYRIDDQLREQPDIANGMPSISADGLTYTFHLRHDVRFWNGQPVTTQDVIYSWSRASVLQAGWSFVFQPVVGYDALASGKAHGLLAGLSAPDAYTLVARLTSRVGYWITELALPAAWVVSQTAIEAGGADNWWTSPSYLLGTGPFRLTSWTSGSELDFAAVSNWWGGSTGALKRIEVHVEHDAAARWKGYLEGTYDILGGLGNASLAFKEGSFLDSVRSDARLRGEIHTWPFGNTTWLGFNLQSGPFSGYGDGTALRRAFIQSIDHRKLADAVCQGGTICVPATGGLIAKGLQGYLGDGADSAAIFDPTAARATVNRLDPDGSRLRGLVFYYPATTNYDPAQAVAENLRAQWSANLGIDVTIRGLDPETFFTDLTAGRFTLWRFGWQADYDHPQDWFDNLFLLNGGCEQTFCNNAGAVYDRPGYADLISSADMQPLAAALPNYRKAGQMLVNDSALGALCYFVRTAVVKPYVEGYGANALWEYRWTSISILQH